jgi:hypothetical protein
MMELRAQRRGSGQDQATGFQRGVSSSPVSSLVGVVPTAVEGEVEELAMAAVVSGFFPASFTTAMIIRRGREEEEGEARREEAAASIKIEARNDRRGSYQDAHQKLGREAEFCGG